MTSRCTGKKWDTPFCFRSAPSSSPSPEAGFHNVEYTPNCVASKHYIIAVIRIIAKYQADNN
jgi:hypothetical protein